MYFLTVLVIVLFSLIWVFQHRYFAVPVNDGNTQAVGLYYGGEIAINCGSVANTTAQDGREWTGESASKFISGQSTSSIVVEKSFLGVDPVPYMTSRISFSPFHFTFQVNPGQKFIRFHFNPASYRGFEKSMDLFTLKAGPFTLLRDFSPTLTSGRLGVKYLVKEFCINVGEQGKLNITLSPSKTSKSKNHMPYAFVNGIEIISMPTGLYYTSDYDFGAPIVGQNQKFYSIDNGTALEMVQRLNIGGNLISSAEDFGMFRRWTADAGYFLESGISLTNYVAPKLATYTNMPLFIAPPKIYQTSWKTARTIGGHQAYSFTWKIPINLGFGYLVRLHFWDFDAAAPDSDAKEFSILINNQIAETQADVERWTSGTGIPVYKDYVVMMRGDKERSECDLFIALRSLNGLALGLLKGMEIFKLSNLENSLATPSPASLMKVSTTGNLKIQRFFSRFSKSDVIGTVMTILISIVGATVYRLREIWEENVHDEKDAQLASIEHSCRCFSLADIKLATQDFSDAFIIGKGGFGQVYKGSIYGIQQTVAIKRLSSFSRQGAREFWTEIETLSKLQHIHLVSLIGYCNENGEMILVYEYISGGTLADNLYKFARKGKDCALLSWEQRLRICIGAARGLEYLHTGSETGIIHRDVKDTNILLDENFIPKISDFGLSKLEKLTQSRSYVSTNIKGTRGYLDPDYCTTHRLTRKSDVYAFGVVLLVVLSGRPALNHTNPGEPESLVACFEECLSRGEFDRMVDPNLSKKISPESLKEFLKSVENCLQQRPKNRPTMAQLVGNLEQVLQQQERPIISTPGDAAGVVQHFEVETSQSGEMSQGSVAPTLEDSVASPPAPGEEVTRRKVPSRGKAQNRILKTFWVWTWKIALNRGHRSAAHGSPDSSDISHGVGRRSAAYGSPDSSDIDGSSPSLDVTHIDTFVQFSFKELAEATSYFSLGNRIGEGSLGPVYYSELRGEKVAIKEMKVEDSVGFLPELGVLAQVRHKNMVGLIGYCVEGGSLFLVLEYIDNGNLSFHLHGSEAEPLSWSTRVQIALDSARALEYIHERSVPVYIHRNIKSSNILIDTSFHAKVSDFYLAKLAEVSSLTPRSYPDADGPWLQLQEYIYKYNGRVSPKSDVYAFGVVLYELISARIPLITGIAYQSTLHLVDLLYLDDLNWVDPRLGDNYPSHSVIKMAKLARACTEHDPEVRPSMSYVVGELKKLRLSSPPEKKKKRSRPPPPTTSRMPRPLISPPPPPPPSSMLPNWEYDLSNMEMSDSDLSGR